MAEEKSRNTIADYVGDMVALEDHIEEALDHQLELTKDSPVAAGVVKQFHDMVKRNRDELKQHQQQVGTTAGNPIIDVGSTLLGKAAGLIDKVRTEGISKALRDDYTAFNHVCIGYTMLNVTALALGDRATAQLSARHLEDYAGAVQKINHVISDVVIEELRKDDHTIVNANAAQDNRKVVDRAWQESKDDSSSTMTGSAL
jgi:ferritin-like metal-binding protein YciE